MKRLLLRIISLLMIFVMLVLGTVKLLEVSTKIVVSSSMLLWYRVEASQVIDTYTWDIDSGLQKIVADRQATIYESPDPIIRWFGNQNILVKILVLLLALAIYPLTIFAWIYEILFLRKNFSKRKISQKAKQT